MSLVEFMQTRECTTCGGRRLKPESLAVTVAERNIGEIVEMPITSTLSFFEGVALREDGHPGLDPQIAGPILKEIRERLRFLNDVGLEYLTLGRSAESLSGGEAQRIRLATQIGSRSSAFSTSSTSRRSASTSATTRVCSTRSGSSAISATRSSSSSTTRRRCGRPIT